MRERLRKARLNWVDNQDLEAPILSAGLSAYFALIGAVFVASSGIVVARSFRESASEKFFPSESILSALAHLCAGLVLLNAARLLWIKRRDGITWGVLSIAVMVVLWLRWPPLFSEVMAAAMATVFLIWLAF
jgi:predicted anti-sigma-YlaC factor YlaD